MRRQTLHRGRYENSEGWYMTSTKKSKNLKQAIFIKCSILALKGMVIKKTLRHNSLFLDIKKGGKQKKLQQNIKKGAFNSFFLKKVNFSVFGCKLLPPYMMKSRKTTFLQCLRSRSARMHNFQGIQNCGNLKKISNGLQMVFLAIQNINFCGGDQLLPPCMTNFVQNMVKNTHV